MSLNYEDCYICDAMTVETPGHNGHSFCRDCDPDLKMHMFNYSNWGKVGNEEYSTGLNEIITEYRGAKMLKKLST